MTDETARKTDTGVAPTTIASRIGSVLFVHGEPLSRKKLATTLGEDADAVDGGIATLRAGLADAGLGIRVVERDGEVELVTDPDNAGLIAGFLSSEREEGLGKATLETLAVIAYRGPVTRSEIDAIRGVNSSFSLRSLLLRGLVDREQNPLDTREYRYSASFRLLELLGIASLDELPDHDTLSADERLRTALDTLAGEDPDAALSAEEPSDGTA